MLNLSVDLEKYIRERLNTNFNIDAEESISAIKSILYQVDLKQLRTDIVKWLTSLMLQKGLSLPEIYKSEGLNNKNVIDIFKQINKLSEEEINKTLANSKSFKELEKWTRRLSLIPLLENPNIENLKAAIAYNPFRFIYKVFPNREKYSKLLKFLYSSLEAQRFIFPLRQAANKERVEDIALFMARAIGINIEAAKIIKIEDTEFWKALFKSYLRDLNIKGLLELLNSDFAPPNLSEYLPTIITYSSEDTLDFIKENLNQPLPLLDSYFRDPVNFIIEQVIKKETSPQRVRSFFLSLPEKAKEEVVKELGRISTQDMNLKAKLLIRDLIITAIKWDRTLFELLPPSAVIAALQRNPGHLLLNLSPEQIVRAFKNILLDPGELRKILIALVNVGKKRSEIKRGNKIGSVIKGLLRSSLSLEDLGFILFSSKIVYRIGGLTQEETKKLAETFRLYTKEKDLPKQISEALNYFKGDEGDELQKGLIKEILRLEKPSKAEETEIFLDLQERFPGLIPDLVREKILSFSEEELEGYAAKTGDPRVRNLLKGDPKFTKEIKYKKKNVRTFRTYRPRDESVPMYLWGKFNADMGYPSWIDPTGLPPNSKILGWYDLNDPDGTFLPQLTNTLLNSEYLLELLENLEKGRIELDYNYTGEELSVLENIRALEVLVKKDPHALYVIFYKEDFEDTSGDKIWRSDIYLGEKEFEKLIGNTPEDQINNLFDAFNLHRIKTIYPGYLGWVGGVWNPKEKILYLTETQADIAQRTQELNDTHYLKQEIQDEQKDELAPITQAQKDIGELLLWTPNKEEILGTGTSGKNFIIISNIIHLVKKEGPKNLKQDFEKYYDLRVKLIKSLKTWDAEEAAEEFINQFEAFKKVLKLTRKWLEELKQKIKKDFRKDIRDHVRHETGIELEEGDPLIFNPENGKLIRMVTKSGIDSEKLKDIFSPWGIKTRAMVERLTKDWQHLFMEEAYKRAKEMGAKAFGVVSSRHTKTKQKSEGSSSIYERAYDKAAEALIKRHNLKYDRPSPQNNWFYIIYIGKEEEEYISKLKDISSRLYPVWG